MPRALGERLHLLRKRLMFLKCGPGAAVLPPSVSRIHMDFAKHTQGGHMGPRKFWRDMLPRLKYHNPLIPMIVNRHDLQSQHPVMTIYFRNDPSSSSSSADPTTSFTAATQPSSSRNGISKAQPPLPDERLVTIDMKSQAAEQILEQFLKQTEAQVLSPDADDLREMQDLDKLAKQSDKDRNRLLRKKAEKADEKRRLEESVALSRAAEETA